MTQITQGREIAETDQQRFKQEIKRFDHKIAPRLLAVLRDGIIKREEVAIRCLIKLSQGQISVCQLQADVVIDLDDE